MLENEPVEGLAIDGVSGGSVQNTGAGDRVFPTDFDITPISGTQIIPGSWISVANVSQIGLFVDFTKGSLTSADINVQFADRKITSIYDQQIITTKAAVTIFAALSWRFATTGKYVIFFPNPGAFQMRFKIIGNGTTTGSRMILQYGRGWGNAKMLGM